MKLTGRSAFTRVIVFCRRYCCFWSLGIHVNCTTGSRSSISKTYLLLPALLYGNWTVCLQLKLRVTAHVPTYEEMWP